MYTYYGVLHSGYEDIKGIAEGNFNLHKTFLDALLVVSPAVQGDPRVAAIVSEQEQIVQSCSQALARFRASGQLSGADLDALSTVYAAELDRSSEDMSELSMVLTDGTLRMSDDERLSALDRIHRDLQQRLQQLRYINSSVARLLASRSGLATELQTLKNLYGL
jgi:hypothetical protein